jgi:hypothetical protein
MADSEEEEQMKDLKVVAEEDEDLRSALVVAGLRQDVIELVPHGLLTSFRSLIQDGQHQVVSGLLKEIHGLDVTMRTHLLVGLATITDSALDPEERKSNILYYIPVINVVYEVFFDEPPDSDNIKEILNLFGIMGALLFTLIVAFYGALDPGRLNDMTPNWEEGGPYYLCMGFTGELLTKSLVLNIGFSQNLSFVSFISTMLAYALFCTTEFEKDSDKSYWWFWVKFTVFGDFVLIVLSIIFLFAGLQNFTLLCFPNAFAAQNCAAEGATLLWQMNNLWGASQVYCALTLALIGIPMLCLMSYGVAMKAKNRDARNKLIDTMSQKRAMQRQSLKVQLQLGAAKTELNPLTTAAAPHGSRLSQSRDDSFTQRL